MLAHMRMRTADERPPPMTNAARHDPGLTLDCGPCLSFDPCSRPLVHTGPDPSVPNPQKRGRG
eukprot:2123398-Prymnesium_polylepis.1